MGIEYNPCNQAGDQAICVLVKVSSNRLHYIESLIVVASLLFLFHAD